MTWGPFFARVVMDKTVPLFSVIVGGAIVLVSIVIGTYTGEHTVAGPIIQALGQDLGIQTSQIANRTAIYSTAPKARNRVNTSYMVCVFLGQTAGTLIGNRLYARGGWTASGSASVGFISMALVVSFARGPHEKGWVGWGGGWNIRKEVPVEVKKDEEAQRAHREGAEEDKQSNVKTVAGANGGAEVAQSEAAMEKQAEIGAGHRR
jgi:MFS family permease